MVSVGTATTWPSFRALAVHLRISAPSADQRRGGSVRARTGHIQEVSIHLHEPITTNGTNSTFKQQIRLFK